MWNKQNMTELVRDLDYLYAHKTATTKETLYKHSERAFQVFEYISNKKKIDQMVDKILNDLDLSQGDKRIGKLSLSAKQLIKDMFANVIYLHDIGKINPSFQYTKMDNDLSSKFSIPNVTAMESKHSFLSTAIYLDIFYPLTKAIKHPLEQRFVQYLLCCFSFVIYTHHENLYNLDELFSPETFEKKIGYPLRNYAYEFFYNRVFNIPKKLWEIPTKIKSLQIGFDGIALWILMKLLHSLLISSDFISSYQFFNGIEEVDIDLGLIENSLEIADIYTKSDIYQGIKAYAENKTHFVDAPINALRSEMFLEAERNLLQHQNQSIFNLEMPTGAGKTNSSINLALKLLQSGEYDKLFYIFPFNTLVDQTKKSFKKLFDTHFEFESVNSISPVLSRHFDTGEVDYTKTLLDRQLFNYPAVFTSHVNLFRTFFGIGRQSSMPLFQLCNSVIILDEIQSYRNTIWREMIEFIYRYSEYLNIKIIIMSATLPNLEKLIGFDSERFVPLIENPSLYYQHPLFTNRVAIDTSLAKRKSTHKLLIKKVKEAVEERNACQKQKGLPDYSMVLVEFIKKESANVFYEEICQSNINSDCMVLELTGDDGAYEREQILDIIKNNTSQNIILVTTQIIEAGVDIDMDIGFKDTALLDNDEQFLGRINRSCLKQNCKAYFFNMDNEKAIYQEDLRLGKNLSNDQYYEYLVSKNFEPYYEENFRKIHLKNNELSRQGMNSFYANLRTMKFEDISKHLQLIEDNSFQIFVPYVLRKEGKKQDETIKIDGKKVWSDYVSLIENSLIGYAEKAISLQNMRETLNMFTYQVYGSGIAGLEPIGGLFYIEAGERFVINNKFKRKEFERIYTILK
ncbi:CRISPR-associated helicase Cas3' (plasmid) [Aneurinibacillus sp. Ricciae_BoGa-3]|uniref:CRISPR-associated helicase Cas3' n=1 Tax=Aneurinibacillus sp. Ricciae_BoGa-3 TaxID=3022697 RepID=UPI00234288D6|nr:CRISPR-associated helicase Cas3' [Aneurinibacillus sp. Ricciae_BoGa-3]WCK57160.1 CRISPR-associated helicase Cas3' [Aneurinibacillus sp. Ricciae_BoGa-3]